MLGASSTRVWPVIRGQGQQCGVTWKGTKFDQAYRIELSTWWLNLTPGLATVHMLLSSMSSILMSSRGKMRCLQNRFWSPRSIATIGPPDAVDILPNDASPDENVVEEKEVFFPPSRPGPLHEQSLRQKTSALVGYLYPRGAEDILWIFGVRGKEPEIKLLCQPVSW